MTNIAIIARESYAGHWLPSQSAVTAGKCQNAFSILSISRLHKSYFKTLFSRWNSILSRYLTCLLHSGFLWIHSFLIQSNKMSHYVMTQQSISYHQKIEFSSILLIILLLCSYLLYTAAPSCAHWFAPQFAERTLNQTWQWKQLLFSANTVELLQHDFDPLLLFALDQINQSKILY